MYSKLFCSTSVSLICTLSSLAECVVSVSQTDGDVGLFINKIFTQLKLYHLEKALQTFPFCGSGINHQS